VLVGVRLSKSGAREPVFFAVVVTEDGYRTNRTRDEPARTGAVLHDFWRDPTLLAMSGVSWCWRSWRVSGHVKSGSALRLEPALKTS